MTSIASLGPNATADLRTLAVARDVVAHLSHAETERLDVAVDESLQRLGRHLSVDRTYVFRRDGSTVSNTHEWCAPGISPEIENLQQVPLDVIAFWQAPLEAGRSIHVPDVSALPDARAAERELLAEQGIQSLLVVPLTSLGRWWGFVGFDAVRERRSFGDAEQLVLRSVADVLTAALVNAESVARAALSEERLAVLTANAAELVTIVADGHVAYASPSWRRVGVRPEDVVGRGLGTMFALADTPALEAALVLGADTRPAEGRWALPDVRLAQDPTRWVRGVVTDLSHLEQIGGLVISQHEVTDQLHAEERLRHLASHDHLTGLPNRVALRERLLGTCLPGAPTPVHVMMLDLDGFKLVNDSRGHDTGDALLVEVAARLRRAAGDDGQVCRFGGDEFVIVHEGDTRDLDRLAEALLDCFRRPFLVDGERHRITASIGVARWRDTRRSPITLIGDADMAMFSAKSGGRNRVVHFDDDFRAGVVRRQQIVDRLASAIDAGHIAPHHQPIVDLATSRAVGHEALARWQDPVLGRVGPDEFIPVAEQVGLIDQLGRRILRDALESARAWPDHQYASVNLSVSQLHAATLVDEVASVLDDTGMPPHRLVVEITESRVMHDPDRAIGAVRSLRSLGVRIAMDDFGTGHSSLALLHDLPLDILKIDRAFVRTVDADTRARNLVVAILGICTELGLVTVAEGVERESQHRALTELGCDLGQGWLFGRPVPDPMAPERSAVDDVRRPTGS